MSVIRRQFLKLAAGAFTLPAVVAICRRADLSEPAGEGGSAGRARWCQ